MSNVWCDTDKKIIYFSDNVGEQSIGQLAFNLLSLIHVDDEKDSKEKDYERKPIKLYINSFGGEIYSMWGIINIILSSKTPIHTYCTGTAMSAAFEIFLAGHKRFCYKYSSFMYHNMYLVRESKYQDHVEDREVVDRLNKTIEDWTAERTKISKEIIEEIRCKKIDKYYNADEALELGIVDEVL